MYKKTTRHMNIAVLAAIAATAMLVTRGACCGAPPPAPAFQEEEQPPIDPATFDKYGGSTLLQCSGGPGERFYTEKIGDRWWLCTPAGNVFWAMGVYNAIPENAADTFGVNPYKIAAERYATGPSKYAPANWCLQTVRRLKSWGFNTLDMYAYKWILPWVDQGSMWPKDPATKIATIPEKMPAMTSGHNPTYYSMYNLNNYVDQPVKDLMTGIRASVYGGWRSPIADYYDSRFNAWMTASFTASRITTNLDWLLGFVVDDTDKLWWAGAGTEFPTSPPGHYSAHAGWVALATAPVQAAAKLSNGVYYAFPDTLVQSKLHLGNFLEQKYGNVEALNAAWASGYTTFGSTGTAVTNEPVAVADGVADTFLCVLTQPQPSPFSVQIFVDGKLQFGDNGEGIFIAGGASGGEVNYETGGVKLVLNPAPSNGAAITVNYVSCGFGCGTGLLDEDGTNEWVPGMPAGKLNGGTDQIRADLDEFLYEYASHYFSTVKACVNQHYPGHLYFGPTSIGSWGSPARRQVLQAAGRYVDVLRTVSIDRVKTGPDWQERRNYIAEWGGDKPWTIWTGARANPDSYWTADTRSACANYEFPTQQDRGDWYQGLLRSFLQPTSDGVRHLVGVNFWELMDNRRECSNWGLITRRDNPYDGVSAVMAPGVDQWGYPTGGETADFGDFLSAARAVNSIWVPRPVVEATRFNNLQMKDVRAR